MERLAALRRRRRRLSRARRPAPAASAGWATAAAATLGGGARPCASRRASQSLSESDATSGTREASEACSSPCSIVIRFIFFTHFCDSPVKTELIYKIILLKTVVIVSKSAQ